MRRSLKALKRIRPNRPIKYVRKVRLVSGLPIESMGTTSERSSTPAVKCLRI